MKNISSMAALAALLLVSCGQDTDVKFAGDEGAKVTFSASINEQNSQDVSRVTGVTWDDGDEVSISCGPTQKNVFYRYNAADNSFTAINRFDEIWLLGNEEYDVTAYYPHVGEEGTVPPVQIVEITSENQDTPEERAAFDFLYASTKATKAEPNVHLNFNHAMSRVNLEFVPGTDPEGNPVTLTDIECYLVGIKRNGTFDTETGVAAVAEDAAVSDLRQMLNADNDHTFTAYLLPQTIGAEGLQIEAAMTTADGRRIYYFLEIPVSDWQIAADQGGTKYTQSDLMTSSSKAEDGRLQGKVSFTMLHEMALAVLKIPNLVYDFTNGGLDDYSLNVAPKELLINDVKTTPYYDAASGTYMALVKPETNYSISGTYQGAKEMAFSAAGSLASGKAKMYIINDNDANKLDYTLQIGDYLCADGNLVSVDAATVPDNAIGVVCYVGNPQPHVYAPDACSETQDALYRDYPNCSHGLVLSLNNAVLPDGTATSQYHTSKSGTYDTWFDSDEEWAGKFVYCNSNRDGNLKNDALTMFPAFFGYNNTVLMTMVTEEGKGSPSTCDNAYSFIVAYRNAVAVPSAATPWYIPSIKDWQQVADNLTNINKSIIKVGGEEMTSVDNGALTGHYWSSTQRNDTFQWTHGMDGGAYNLICERGSRAGQFRMMLAF